MKNNGIHIFWLDTSDFTQEEQLLHFSAPFHLKRKPLNGLNFRQKKVSIFSKHLLAYGLRYIQEKLPESISFRTNGKPYFEDSPIHFNISHSNNLVVCGVAYQNFGIDLQQIIPFKKGIEGVFLDTYEKDKINSEDFLKVWSKKEAAYKGFGFELGAKLTDFKYECTDLMLYQNHKVKLIEQNIIQGYYCFLAVDTKSEHQVNISNITINQLNS
ncbi:MAG: hypothetical protein MUF58_02420 [Arcicella sp.]|jgi:4'-phosphopantetheinyl transferase|nr:hypothetical protein [Arcicella sp.]